MRGTYMHLHFLKAEKKKNLVRGSSMWFLKRELSVDSGEIPEVITPKEPVNNAGQNMQIAPQQNNPGQNMQRAPQRNNAGQNMQNLPQQKRFCRNCGTELAPNAKFCKNCGTPV